jgi:aspartate racemase
VVLDFGKKENIGIGIVGGVGPETSAKFYFIVVNRVCKMTGQYPNVIVDNVPISTELDERMILGKGSKVIFRILKRSIERLNKLDVNLIVIPCNTVHVYFNRLRKISKSPMLNIIDQTVFASRVFRKVGVLATTTTVKSKLYQKSFKRFGVSPILPNQIMQQKISEIVIKILRDRVSSNDIELIDNIIEQFLQEGAEALVLGCTDLQLLIKEDKIKLIDSMKALEDATVEFIVRGMTNA